jgi:hypothetical protein
MRPMLKEFNISSTERLYKIINTFLLAANDVSEDHQFDLAAVITKATLFKILITHSRAIISIISDNNSEDIDKISEHKKYLIRSLPGSFQEIVNSKAYLKSVEVLDRKLLRRNLTI